MKKQLLFVLVFVASSLSLSAQTWNFSFLYLDVSIVESKVSYSYTETIDVNGLTIYAASGKSVDIDYSKISVDDVEYIARLKFGGTGAWAGEGVTPPNRVLSF